MQILHALVGYLAISSLPIHPFAFASPLEIGYDSDGYVNMQNLDNTHMKNILDSLLEMAVTTKNHSDTSTALMKRVPGDIIEARQEEGDPAEGIPVGWVIAVIIGAAILSLIWISTDNGREAQFTQNTITNTYAKYPKFNWVICHSPYSTAFDGVEGTDWGMSYHQELKISWGRTRGYDLYWAKSGTFNRYGDGGFVNWAYNGNIIGKDNDGATVHFGVIS